MNEELRPSNAADLLKRFGAQTAVVETPSGCRYRIRKFNIADEQCAGMLALPYVQDALKRLRDAKEAGKDVPPNPVDAARFQKAAILTLVIEPKIVEGTASPEKNEVSIFDIPAEEQSALGLKIFEFSGFTSQAGEFFRKDGDGGGSGA